MDESGSLWSAEKISLTASDLGLGSHSVSWTLLKTMLNINQAKVYLFLKYILIPFMKRKGCIEFSFCKSHCLKLDRFYWIFIKANPNPKPVYFWESSESCARFHKQLVSDVLGTVHLMLWNIKKYKNWKHL